MAEREKEREGRALTPWRPFAELSRLERQMERMWDEFTGGRLRPWRWRWGWPERLGEIVPAVDLYEEKDEIVAKVELPGLEKDDVQVNITDNLLTIKGEKKKEEEIKEEDYYCCERSYGSFSRTIELPRAIQVDKARASFKKGVLEIRIPKTEEAKKKEIKVKVD